MDKIGDNDKIQRAGIVQVKRDKLGRVLPGSSLNPAGSLPDKLKIDTDSLLESLKTVEKAKHKPILQHIWERAYKSDTVLKALMDKFIANKGVPLDQFGNAGQFNVTIQYFGKKDKDTEDTKTIDI